MSPHDLVRRRVRRPLAAGVPLAVVVALVAAGTAAGAPAKAEAAHVTRTATLDDIPLGAFSNALLPGTVDNDRGVDLGGIGSDICPAGRKGEYWTVTDRGPNGQIKVGGTKRRTFPVPGFDPAIVKIRVSGDKVKVLDALPITTSSGKAVSGLPNQQGRDEAPYSYDAQTALSYNPNGLDTEGIVRAGDGSFWLVDEYGPSLVHVSARGKVLTRYVPKGLHLTGADYPVVEALPAVLLHRKTNRGFEGLAQLPGGDLVMALQSPLSLPDGDAGDASLNTRLWRFSTKKKAVTAEYAYRFDPVNVVDPGEDDTSELKISSVVAVGDDRLLVEERTDKAARLQMVKLSRKSNILGGRYDDDTTSPSLEQLDDQAASGVPVLAKKLVVDLGTVSGVPQKIEGIARVDHDTLALVNDNDFGMTDGAGAFDAQGRLVDSGIETTVVYLKLPHGI
ncbi:esterase-like activity of phytase family protein [Streptomyces sp. NPDC051554]|uniref:esterase-like activity of phytase family protein n=1 Tax=Streptomyces sp. NPDC051554 TaxID=3365656 RepID=UPI00379E5646